MEAHGGACIMVLKKFEFDKGVIVCIQNKNVHPHLEISGPLVDWHFS